MNLIDRIFEEYGEKIAAGILIVGMILCSVWLILDYLNAPQG